MAKGRPVILAGLDTGTSKTAVVIAEAGSGSLRLLGAGMSPAVGLQRGIITGPDAAARSIRQALEKAEKMAGVRVASVFAGYNGAGTAVRGLREIAPEGGRFPSGAVLPAAAAGAERVLQLLPVPFAAGLPAAGAGAAVRAITAPAGHIDAIVESARLAGLAVEDVIYGPVAAAQELLTPAERELGTMLVEIGAGITSVSIFDRGTVQETAVIPLGGEHLISDLAIGLRVSLARAGEILKGRSSPPGEFTGTAGQPGKGCGEAPTEDKSCLIEKILAARIAEILDLVAAAVRNFGYPGSLPGGAVICGGVCRLRGLAPLAEERLQVSVRVLAEKNGVSGWPAPGPEYHSALGLVRCAFARLGRGGAAGGNLREHLAGRLTGWLKDRRKGERRLNGAR
ncbi:MAG: hypothetical protein K6T29_04575 [Peptococcaceae bacterium]|nr:hypothetical protein [Peptococcaceae bacterium]